MALMTNPWVGYIDRSYQQIKRAIIDKLPVNVPEITDHSEGNLMIVIIGMFSGIGEMLGYYIDNMAREAFITTARRFSSAVKLTRLIDYRIKAAIPASADLVLSFLDGNDPFMLTSDYTVNVGTAFSDTQGNQWLSTKTVTVGAGLSQMVIPVRQQTLILANNLGTTDGSANQQFSLGFKYVDDTATITINSVAWERQPTLGRSKPFDNHFIVEIDENQEAFAKFGDGVNGAIPPTAQSVIADYFETEGIIGNDVQVGDINTIDTPLVPPVGASLEVINPSQPAGGVGYESLDSIKKSAPLSIRTLDRAVTRQDYVDIAVLAPGVELAALEFECGKTIDIYIAPVGGGLAQQALLDSTEDWVNQRKMVTTLVNVLPAGETFLDLRLDVTAKFRIPAASAEADIREALINAYQFESSDINRPIRTSDIIALVDNLEKVDYLTVGRLATKPYARPLVDAVALNWTAETQDDSNSIKTWRLKYSGTNFLIFRDSTYLGNLLVGVPFTDDLNTITFTINSGAYLIGMEWEFKTYPVNANLELDDFTVPILRDQDLIINVTEQLVNAN